MTATRTYADPIGVREAAGRSLDQEHEGENAEDPPDSSGASASVTTAAISPVRKAAIVLVSLDQSLASQLLTHLDRPAVEAVTWEIARLDRVDQAERAAVLEEFYGLGLRRLCFVFDDLVRMSDADIRTALHEEDTDTWRWHLPAVLRRCGPRCFRPCPRRRARGCSTHSSISGRSGCRIPKPPSMRLPRSCAGSTTAGASACPSRTAARKCSSEHAEGLADAAADRSTLENALASGSALDAWHSRRGRVARAGARPRRWCSGSQSTGSAAGRVCAPAGAATGGAAEAGLKLLDGSTAADGRPRKSRLILPRRSLPGAGTDGSDRWYMGMAVVALLLAAAGGVTLAARRFTPGTAAGALQVVSRVSLSPKHTVYLLCAGGRVLLVGTGPQGAPALISELDEIPRIEPGGGPGEEP